MRPLILTEFLNTRNLHQLAHTFLRYLLVGGGNAFVCMVFMAIGAWMGLGYLGYTTLGYVVGISVSFFLNLYFTFRVTKHTLKRMLLFFLMNGVNLMLMELIEYTLIDIFSVRQWMAVFFCMGWYTMVGFLMNYLWVYRQELKTT